MGCDIRFTIEAKLGERNTWVGVYSTVYSPILTPRSQQKAWAERKEAAILSTYSHAPLLGDRNYDWFGLLAEVRGNGSRRVADGVPDDASPLTTLSVLHWDGDGHSHSHCSLEVFSQALVETNDVLRDLMVTLNLKEGRVPTAEEVLCGGYHPSDVEYRVVFWFDN